MSATCEHTDRSETAVHVLPAKPRGAHYVHCPCCGMTGWQDNDDPTQMVCPECLVPAALGETS